MKLKLKKQVKTLTGFLLLAVLAVQFSCGTLREFELNRNRRLWSESKVTNYRMIVDLNKTGHATPNGKVVITVRGGVVESIKRVDNPGVGIDFDSFRKYATIERIFEFIETAEKEKEQNRRSWSRREIEYDPKLGYPKKVDLDQSGVFDDELFFQVLQFEVLE